MTAGEVKRRNRGYHAKGLADHVLVDTGGNVFAIGALDEHRHAASGFNVFDGALHLGLALAESLAALVGDRKRERIAMLLDKRLKLKERLHAIDDRGAPPADKCALRDFDGKIHVRGGR